MKNYLVAAAMLIVQSCGIATLDGLGGDTVDPVSFSSLSSEITDEFPTAEAELMTILTGTEEKSWKAVGFAVKLIPGFQTCRLDDTVTFNEDGTYTYDGGSSLCGAEDNVKVKSGNWELDFAGQKLVFDKGTDNETAAEIATAKAGMLILKGDYKGWDLIGKYESN